MRLHFPAAAIVVLLLATSACPVSSQPERSPVVARPGMVLQYDRGTVTLLDGGTALASVERPDALPYQIVQQQSPAIVTTCGPELVPVTYVIGSEAKAYSNMVPQHISDGLAWLAELFSDESALGGRAVVVNGGGETVWEHESALLLLPAAGEVNPSTVLAVPTAGSHLEPFGLPPALIAVDTEQKTELWRSDIPSPAAPDDIQLIASSETWGLLSLQYGYTLFQFVRVDIQTGEMEQLALFSGQPAVSLVQPGAMPEYRGCTVSGDVVQLAVIDEARGSGEFIFDLAAKTAVFAEAELTGEFNREENSLPPGGGSAMADNPPFPQGLLPTAFGDEWEIDALVIGSCFLVVTGNGPELVEY